MRIMPAKPDVEPPAGDLEDAVVPGFRLDDVAQGVEQDGDGEHAVDPHQRSMAVGRRQEGAVLIVRHRREIDQEAEHPCADEVPYGRGDEEPEGRPVRKGYAAFSGSCSAPRLPGSAG